jgi:hypothetical protein
MWIVSIATLIDEASADARRRNATGNVQDLSVVFGEPALRVFEEQHGGVFAFLAFQPGVDTAVETYLTEGSLAIDSGPAVLVFFTAFTNATFPAPVAQALPATRLVVEWADSPARQLTRMLFTDGVVPPLPGLLVFESVVRRREAIYFDLTAPRDAAEVRALLRSILALTERAAVARRENGRGIADLLAVSAQRQRIAFTRSGPVTMRQWLVQSYQFMQRNAGTIAGALGKVIGL